LLPSSQINRLRGAAFTGGRRGEDPLAAAPTSFVQPPRQEQLKAATRGCLFDCSSEI
jgi:hypothetical protein